ncbi:MAG TPA: cobalamin-dependent protein, partial [Calditrichia bacterium]|nr:cobalamin-dependent protein [Calditrichia bacterium]
MPKHKVVLYNPRSVFFDMPLALLAIGSALDSRRFEVEIIDARLTQNPQQALAAALPGALCLGITVLTGAPLADALEMSRYAKRHFPQVPVIWGGWHPSLFPTGPLVDVPEVDITVQGQGEETFRELTEAFAAGNPVDEIPGMAHRRSGEIVRNAPRPLADMNVFPRVDYDLIDVEAYFAKKGRRQFDYISSTGCFFRCSFCADPFVFQRKYSALSPERMISDLRFFQERYGFTDLNFQDETFFTYRERIAAFAAGLVENGIRTTWAATMRADQGSRLGDEVWQL